MAESEEELKSFSMKVKLESEKVGLKLNIQKTKIMASGPITSWDQMLTNTELLSHRVEARSLKSRHRHDHTSFATCRGTLPCPPQLLMLCCRSRLNLTCSSVNSELCFHCHVVLSPPVSVFLPPSSCKGTNHIRSGVHPTSV